MSQILRTLSQLLEARRPQLTTDDLAGLGDGSRDALLNQRILVPAGTTTHVACDACHDDHVEEVTRIKSANGDVVFRIRCPDAGWVEVPGERLRQWTIDIRRLVSMLTESVDSGQTPEELIGGTAWRIGSVEIGGERYEIAFVYNGSTSDDPKLDRVEKKLPPSKTILVVACELPDDAARFAASMPLPSAFDFVGNRIEFQANRIRSAISTGATIDGNVFERRGDKWVLCFEGTTIYPTDTVGLVYIARLLAEPNRDIPAVMLFANRAGIDPRITSGSSGQILTDEAREEYGRHRQDLQEDLEEAKEDNDLGRIEKVKVEIEFLDKQLAAAAGLGGRPRQKSDTEKVRKSVSTAISRAIQRIGKEHESLGRHLMVSIATGLVCRYSPERDAAWLT